MEKELNDLEIKHRLVSLLCKFDDICNKNDLKYSLGYGTLLGAVRHKGFIPWDDDIDVIMPQDDYIKFLRLPCFAEQNSNSKIVLSEPDVQNIYNTGSYFPFAKLMDAETYVKSEFFRENGGLWIDIFPITGLPESNQVRKNLFKNQDKLHSKLAAAHRYRRLTSCTFITFLKQLRCNYYFLLKTCLAKKMKKASFSCSYNSSKEVANSLWGYGEKEIMSRKWYEEYINVEFERHQFKGIKHYDEILTQIYGDWKKLPSEDKRIAHHYYKAYLKDKKF